MALDKATVARIGHLARIRLEEGELDAMAGELNPILAFVEQLNEVPTDGVAPMTGAVAQALSRRADRVDDGRVAERVLANAPDARAGFFTVPKVVE